MDPVTLHGAHMAVTALRLLLAAQADGDREGINLYRQRSYGQHLIEHLHIRADRRVLTLDRDTLTVARPWWSPPPKDPQGRRTPRHVDIPATALRAVAWKRGRILGGLKVTIDAPGHNDPWREPGLKVTHVFKPATSRGSTELSWLVAALWWLRPDLGNWDALPVTEDQPLPEPRRWLWKAAGGRTVRMSTQETGRQRKPDTGATWDQPAGVARQRRRWGGVEGRYQRKG